MRRTTIVQNKIINIICSCLFSCPNIYRPSLMKVQLGRPNPKQLHPLNFYFRKKKLFRIVCTTTLRIPILIYF